MTVIQSETSIRQNDLLAKFTKALQMTKESVTELALAYKACVDAEIDMSRYGRSMGIRLMAVAEGRLMPLDAPRLMALPNALVNGLSFLPKAQQADLLENGVVIWRNGQARKVALEDVKDAEAKRLIDVAGDRGRILTPEEQETRATPAIPKRDQIIEVRLTYEERVSASTLAHSLGKSVPVMLRDMLREASKE
jgi:hypothetical protein